MKKNSFRILLAEDDKNMGFMLQDNFEMAGYQVDSFSDGQTALSAYIKNSYDLCVLDVMMPVKDGFTLAGDIRKLDLKVPIIFLTAKNLPQDRIQGFHLGADDYVTKPFSVEELLLRVQTILKRVYNTPSKADEQFICTIDDLICNFSDQKIQFRDTVVELTNKEAKLLRLFCNNQNKIIERDLIQKAIWEDEGYFVGRSMDVFISRLRKILSICPAISISNVHGVGYKLEVIQQQSDSQHP